MTSATLTFNLIRGKQTKQNKTRTNNRYIVQQMKKRIRKTINAEHRQANEATVEKITKRVLSIITRQPFGVDR